MGSNEERYSAINVKYHTRENLSQACSDIIEDLLRKAYEEDDPLTTAPIKCSKYTQTIKRVQNPGSKGLFDKLKYA